MYPGPMIMKSKNIVQNVHNAMKFYIMWLIVNMVTHRATPTLKFCPALKFFFSRKWIWIFSIILRVY